MKILNFTFESSPADRHSQEVICGVVGSGNLEVLATPFTEPKKCAFIVNTSVTGFDHVWEAVLKEFSSRYVIGGLSFQLNDMGATPAVVSLRLGQAITLLQEAAHE